MFFSLSKRMGGWIPLLLQKVEFINFRDLKITLIVDVNFNINLG